jgi:glycosyltransferase involved in cell wall biosynthesis
VRVLAIDHTAGLAGGEVALARLLEGIDRERYEPYALLLEDGPLASRLRAASVITAVLPASRALTGAGREDVASSPLRLVMNALRTAALLPRVSAAIRSSGADLVVANTLKSAVIVALAAPLAGRRWVWHLHDRFAPDYLPRRLVIALRVLARFGPRMVVANSQATRNTLRTLPRGRVVVAYPAVPTSRAATLSAPPTPTFGLLGRIAPTKGQIEFLHATAQLAETTPDVRAIVLGDAMFNDHEFAERVRRLPPTLGIADAVTFTGWVDEPLEALGSLTALIHASPVPEPFGQVVVEGMLAGVPVIATAAGGVPEIVDPDGESEPIADGLKRTPYGLLVRPGDPSALARAMRWVIEHPAAAAEATRRASAMAQVRFGIDGTVQVVQDAWDRALRGGRFSKTS